MTDYDVLVWLKSLGALDGAQWTTARLDTAKERRVGVYQSPSYGGREVALGGDPATLDRTKRMEVLVHWTRDELETEQASQALYDAVAGEATSHPGIGGATATYVDLRVPEPASIGATEHGIFERMIPLDIHYQ